MNGGAGPESGAASEVLRRHRVPPWWEDGKLGIFVHWGLFSVPGWAPKDANDGAHLDLDAWARGENAYAEWYENSLRVPGSPTALWHAENYGNSSYAEFRQPFEEAASGWDPGEWADLFAEANASYVILTTKHHDGYLLWPSGIRNPHRNQWQSERDLVGDLADAVRARGMRFGVYYSGGFDWSFGTDPICSLDTLRAAVLTSRTYADYVLGHFRELVERYRPSVLWNDIGLPSEAGYADLFVDYLRLVPDGVINDRFYAADGDLTTWARPWTDHLTPEYATEVVPRSMAWEMCRGLGKSFGYNQAETAADHLDGAGLIRTFTDVVAHGGNLLINVGPTGDGSIPMLQSEPLRELGRWLGTNEAAITRSRPWVRPLGVTSDGSAVRFTQADGSLFAILDSCPAPGTEVTLVDVPDLGPVELLGHGPLERRHGEGGLQVTWPVSASELLPVLRIGPA